MIQITIEVVRHYTIRELRESRGLTQAALAQQAGVSISSIIKIENKKGPFGINFEVADRLSKFFGVPMSEVAWPFAISDSGRPGGTGRPCQRKPSIPEATCPTCHYAMPATGICGSCE